jgi:DNA-binding transcriptional LysR family regulator
VADKFEDLRTYVTVVSCGGINAAAAELGIAKSAVSRRISDMEARLGTVLFERSTRRFEVTATGRSYFDTARDLLSRLEALDADPAAANVAGAVSLASTPAVSRHLLAPAIATFLAGRRGVTVELVDGDEPADVAIAIGPTLKGRHLADSRQVLCASADYLEESGSPSRTADLADHAGIMLDEQRGAWSLAGGATRSPRVTVVASDPDVALALAVASAGIAQLPDFVVDEALAAGTVVALLADDAPPAQPISAALRAGASPIAAALVDHLAACLIIGR